MAGDISLPIQVSDLGARNWEEAHWPLALEPIAAPWSRRLAGIPVLLPNGPLVCRLARRNATCRTIRFRARRCLAEDWLELSKPRPIRGRGSFRFDALSASAVMPRSDLPPRLRRKASQ